MLTKDAPLRQWRLLQRVGTFSAISIAKHGPPIFLFGSVNIHIDPSTDNLNFRSTYAYGFKQPSIDIILMVDEVNSGN